MFGLENFIPPLAMETLVVPLLIFFARVCDVSLATLRIIFIARGKKYLAPVLGFFEVLIWIAGMGTVMAHLNNIACYFAWAAGFAFGSFLGLRIEERLAIGNVSVRIITAVPGHPLAEALREAGFGATVIEASGSQGAVNVIYTIVRRRDLSQVLALVLKFNPRAFYTVEDVRAVTSVFSPATSPEGRFGFLSSRRER